MGVIQGDFDPVAVLLSIQEKVGQSVGAIDELRRSLHDHVSEENTGLNRVNSTLMKARGEIRATQITFEEHKRMAQDRHEEMHEKLSESAERLQTLEIASQKAAGAKAVWVSLFGFVCMVAGWFVSAMMSGAAKPLLDTLKGMFE